MDPNPDKEHPMATITVESVTNAQLSDLAREADTAGDTAMGDIARRAREANTTGDLADANLIAAVAALEEARVANVDARGDWR